MFVLFLLVQSGYQIQCASTDNLCIESKICQVMTYQNLPLIIWYECQLDPDHPHSLLQLPSLACLPKSASAVGFMASWSKRHTNLWVNRFHTTRFWNPYRENNPSRSTVRRRYGKLFWHNPFITWTRFPRLRTNQRSGKVSAGGRHMPGNKFICGSQEPIPVTATLSTFCQWSR